MNRFIHRPATSRLLKLFPARQVLVITGMRRVGKTTQMKYLFSKLNSSNKIWLDMENVLTRQIFLDHNYQNIKHALEQEGLNFRKKAYIFIDEIQFVKNLPSVIKYLYDAYPIKFVVTGSSSYYLKNHFTESLAGRKIIQELYPLTFREFLDFKQITKKYPQSFAAKAQHRLNTDAGKYSKLYREYLQYGGFPEVVLAQSPEIKQEILQDILNSYFQIDITTLAKFSDIAILKNLLTLLTQRIGQKVSITNLANALNLNRAKIYSYLELLQSTYVIKLMPQKSSVDNRVSAGNKVYFHDTGLANVLASISTGSQLENSVFMNLIPHHSLSYFQVKSGGEIDFVVDQKIGLEVKQTPSQQHLSNLIKRSSSAGIKNSYLVSLIPNSALNRLIMVWDL